MQDSIQTVTSLLSSGNATIDMLAPFAFSALIIPLIGMITKLFEWAKETGHWLSKIEPPYELLTAGLWMITVFVLRAFLYPEWSTVAAVEYGFKFLGMSTTLYGGVKLGKLVYNRNK